PFAQMYGECARNWGLTPEDLRQLVRRRGLDLLETALLRRLVVAPSLESRGVAEACTRPRLPLQVVERHFAYQFRSQAHPAHIAGARPAAGLARRAALAEAHVLVVCPVRRQEVDK